MESLRTDSVPDPVTTKNARALGGIQSIAAAPELFRPGPFLIVALLLVGSAFAQSPGFDLIIEGGRVIDGTGNPWYRADLAISEGRIARIAPPGSLASSPARRRLLIHGRLVVPGFIDIQSHSRYAFLEGDSSVISKITQGVTSEIMGEGTSNAPGPDFPGPHGFDAWLRKMQARGPAVNFGSFVGGSTIRAFVKGFEQGAPTEAELERMRTLARLAMEDGAFGIATALVYPPGNFATTEELIEISKTIAPYGGLYITHMRSEADQLLQAIDEALEIGRKGAVPVEIYHLKAAGKRNWFKAPLAIAKIEAARAEGQDVGADMYPYLAGSTSLTACLPPWASAHNQLFANLENPETRERIRSEILDQKTHWENFCGLATPSGVLLLGLQKEANRGLNGKYLSEIASLRDQHWVDTVFDLIFSERQRISTAYFMMSEENLRLQLRQPWMKFGTDAGGVNRNAGLVHPRAWGTFPRILGRYVREESILSWEEAIRKMTSAVADRLRIKERGLLKEGYYADLVVLDPNTVIDQASYEQPHQASVGIEHVFVNGQAVVEDKKTTNARPGQILRGPGYKGGGASEVPP